MFQALVSNWYIFFLSSYCFLTCCRLNAFGVCGEVLTSDESMNSWMDGLMERLENLPEVPEQRILKVKWKSRYKFSVLTPCC